MDNIKGTNIYIIGVSEEREEGAEIIAENVPNQGKEADIQVQEAQRFQNKMNTKRPTARHIVIKMVKVKERILEAARRNSLVVQWLGVHLSMQGLWIQPLV